MSRVDELLARYMAEFRRAGDADPRPYLRELDGADRAELAALIDRFLVGAPPPAFDAARFEARMADPARNAMVDEVLAFDERLVDLRRAARLSKNHVGAGLAERLGLPGQANGAKGAYHDIETGAVPPVKVRPRVWEALSDLYGTSVERLRDAAERAFEQREPSGGLTFARTGSPIIASAMRSPASPGTTDDSVRRAFFED